MRTTTGETLSSGARRCRYMRLTSRSHRALRKDCDHLPGDSAVGLPVAVERALDFDEPDDGPDERDQVPESRDSADELLLSLGGVHVADLRRQQEQVDNVDQNLDDQRDDRADALAGVLLELPEDLVSPVERVDAESDDRKDDHRPRIADLANGSHATPHLLGLRSAQVQRARYAATTAAASTRRKIDDRAAAGSSDDF